MKALTFAVMICPALVLGSGCAEGPYSVGTGPAKPAPAAPVPARKPAIALNEPAIAPSTAAPIPTRKPDIALNQPIIIIGTADGSDTPAGAQTSAQ